MIHGFESSGLRGAVSTAALSWLILLAEEGEKVLHGVISDGYSCESQKFIVGAMIALILSWTPGQQQDDGSWRAGRLLDRGWK